MTKRRRGKEKAGTRIDARKKRKSPRERVGETGDYSRCCSEITCTENQILWEGNREREKTSNFFVCPVKGATYSIHYINNEN